MAASYERPFEPVQLDERAAALFRLEDLIAQLRREDAYRAGGRSALTLLHGEGLTVVLTVVREGEECEEHAASDPMMLVGVDGTLAVKGACDGGVMQLPPRAAAAVAPDVVHSLAAVTDAAYLTIIGERSGGSGS